MEICNAKSGSRLQLVVVFILILQVASCFAEEPHKAPERPSFGNFIHQSVAIFKKSHLSPWDKMKSLLHQMQLQFFPPNLDFRSRDDETKGMVDEMKEAVERSFGVSKHAVEGSAKSAAKAMEEAVDKVKENLVDKDKDQHDEL